MSSSHTDFRFIADEKSQKGLTLGKIANEIANGHGYTLKGQAVFTKKIGNIALDTTPIVCSLEITALTVIAGALGKDICGNLHIANNMPLGEGVKTPFKGSIHSNDFNAEGNYVEPTT